MLSIATSVRQWQKENVRPIPQVCHFCSTRNVSPIVSLRRTTHRTLVGKHAMNI